ncbi:amino acid adenylation domain-containing protein [Nonomuraea sp. NPDC050643]|uniref:non-ribosomal peptide synthetase n=1 Tax=Nonomuraea sp. NPDC050643 TaxID=3155660 RepID=UPI00340DC732
MDGHAAAQPAPADGLTPERLSALPPGRRAQMLEWPAQAERRTYPLSPKQRGMWFLDRLVGDLPLYSVPWMVRLRGDLDTRTLRRALEAVVERHEILRTRFVVADDGVPAQEVLPELTPGWHETWADPQDLAGIAAEVAARPFVLDQGPLIRLEVVHLAGREHVLIVNVHHIVVDGWSMGVLTDELWAHYTAFLGGRSPALPPVAVQYGPYAERCRRELDGGGLDRQIAYWTRRLAGAPAVLELPLDRPRPAVNDHRGAAAEIPLDPGLLEAVKDLSRSERGTLFMTFFAAFAVLVHRLTGQSSMTIGVPSAGRVSAELQDLIGLFMTVLPLRAELTGEMTFRDVLAQVRRTSMEAFAQQDVPADVLVDRLRPDRTLSHNPLYQVLFSVEEHATHGDVPGLEMDPLEEIWTGSSKFDLTWTVWADRERPRSTIEYRSALFDDGTVRHFADLFATLLRGVLAAPDAPIAELPLLTPSDRAAIAGLNPAFEPIPGTPAHRLFEERCARDPGAIAVEFGAETLTYDELNRRANRLAHRLRALGVGPDTPVGICAERSPMLVAAILGVLKAGGGYVPLDPGHPDERLDLIIEDSRMPVLLTTQGGRFAGRVDTVIALEDAPGEETNPVHQVTPGHLAYIIFTSGSTGRPKGVQIPHRALSTFASYVRRTPGLTSRDIVLAPTTAAFDISVYELVATLTAGARVVLATERQARDGKALLDLRARSGANVLNATPATYRLLVEAGWEPTPGLRVVSSGELLPTDLAAEIIGRADEVWNMYGPTETTVWCSHRRIGPGLPPTPVVPIGRPTDNTTMYVLDDHLRPVPVGVAGELYVGGDLLARGYRDRPGLTAERFLPDPLAAEPGARMYRTGDRGRLLAGGELEYLGRADFQIKLRGHRIEPGEIETLLRADPGVDQAVVIKHETAEQLVAYVVGTADPALLRGRLAGRLPAYMIPETFLTLDAMPLSPNGKLDRDALPDPVAGVRARQSATAYVAPRTELEAALGRAWEQVLGLDRVGAGDDFFDLGGHSLDVLKLTARVESELGHVFAPADLFQHPTVEQLAALLESGPGPASAGPLTTLSPGGPGRPLVLVHPVGGSVLCYAGLAELMGRDRPVYGLTARGADGAEPPLESVEEMAKCYLDALDTAGLPPDRLLGGWSMGGVIALEMARQASGSYEVLMIDSWAPHLAVPGGLDEAGTFALFAEDLGLTAGADFGIDADTVRGMSVEARHDLLRRACDLPPDRLRAAAGVFAANVRAITGYRLDRPFDGPVTLVRAVGSRAGDGRRVPDHGWSGLLTGPRTVLDVPGDHHGCLRPPHVAVTAAAIRNAIEQKRW